VLTSLLLNDRALSEAYAAKIGAKTPSVTSAWMSNLVATISDCLVQIGAGHFGADRIGALEALRQLRSSCVVLLKSSPKPNHDAEEPKEDAVQKRLEQLLICTHDALTRLQRRHDADVMLQLSLRSATRSRLEQVLLEQSA